MTDSVEAPLSPMTRDDYAQLKMLQDKAKAAREQSRGMKQQLLNAFPVVEKFDAIVAFCDVQGKHSIMETFDPPDGSENGRSVIKLTLTRIELDDEQLAKRAKRNATNEEAEED